MRRLLSFILLFSSFSLCAKPTVICGKMEAKPQKKVTIQYYATAIDEIEGRLTHFETNVDGLNNFKFKIDINNPISYSIALGDQWLFANKYIGPGDSLSFDFSDNEQIHTEGSCKEQVSFQFHWESKYFRDDAMTKQVAETFNKQPKVFAEFWQKRMKDQIDFMNTFFRGHVPEPFKTYMESEIRYSYAVALLQYSWKHAAGGRAVFHDAEYMKLINDVNPNNFGSLCSSSYINFLRELPYSLWRCHVDQNNKQSAETKFYLHHQYRQRDSIAKKYFTGRLYEVALYQILHDQIKGLDHYKGTDEFEGRYHAMDSMLHNTYRNSFVDKGMLARLGNDLSFVKAVVVSVPAPDFAVRDMNGKNVKLSDYKGKVVYMSFWSTANEQCIAELQGIKGLQERFKGKNVEFLFVSFDKSKASLQNYLKNNPIEGTHLLELNGMGSDVAKKYAVTTMPRHVLVDKKGNLLNRNAPGPAQNVGGTIDYALQMQ
ncbi:MAG: TlpA disulfide reductase family protein [Bacteroidota bacterium]